MQQNVLIVEGEDNVALALSMVLREWGYGVQRVGQAEQARDVGHHDIVMIDSTLPDGSGFQLCQDLSQAEGQRPPIILMINNHSPLEHRKALAQGATTVLSKPFDSLMLRQALDTVSRRAELA